MLKHFVTQHVAGTSKCAYKYIYQGREREGIICTLDINIYIHTYEYVCKYSENTEH